LAFNYSQGRNVILADEMGLGKTVQCISFLNWLVFSNDCIGPFIVIAPLSTLPHWQREVEAWTHLNSILYHGDQNARDIICEFEVPSVFLVLTFQFNL
jgi:SNF2 family DNA or RNA helicase